MKYSLKKGCTCRNRTRTSRLFGKHYLYCDLMYVKGQSVPRKRKRFGIFYPLKTINKKGS